MKWTPIDLEALESAVARGLSAGGDEARTFYEQVARKPTKWHLHPWGDQGGGFWVVAVYEDRVLWFNDIEDGFNVSTFQQEGAIPTDQYWCNQDELHYALDRLRSGGGDRLRSPRPDDV